MHAGSDGFRFFFTQSNHLHLTTAEKSWKIITMVFPHFSICPPHLPSPMMRSSHAAYPGCCEISPTQTVVSQPGLQAQGPACGTLSPDLSDPTLYQCSGSREARFQKNCLVTALCILWKANNMDVFSSPSNLQIAIVLRQLQHLFLQCG